MVLRSTVIGKWSLQDQFKDESQRGDRGESNAATVCRPAIFRISAGHLSTIGRPRLATLDYSFGEPADLSVEALGGHRDRPYDVLSPLLPTMERPIPENSIRLLLVDDQTLLRTSLSRYLATQPGLDLAGDCGTAAEALGILKASPVDVVLLDLRARGVGGENLLSAALASGYQGRFLIVVGTPDARELATAIKLGASGIFLKSEPLDRLVQAIRLVASGAVWVDQKVIQLLADQLVGESQPELPIAGNLLTEREEKVLLGIMGGLTNRKIGDNIGLSEGTVKSVVQQLFLSAGVRTRSQLVRMALEGSLGAIRSLAERGRQSAPHHDSPDFLLRSAEPAGPSAARSPHR
jgi:DNA-binding NarL/FixJ family response regulator